MSGLKNVAYKEKCTKNEHLIVSSNLPSKNYFLYLLIIQKKLDILTMS